MSHIFHRHTKTVPAAAASGDGVYITDDTGKRYLDASGGAAVSCLGHSHPVVLQAIRDQIERISFAHTGFFTTKAAENLADKLIEKAPGDLEYVYYVSGGSEAPRASEDSINLRNSGEFKIMR